MSEPSNKLEYPVLQTFSLIEEAWTQPSLDDFRAVMTGGARQLVDQAITIGDAALKQIEHTPDLSAYITTFCWPEKVKAFLILWRDILFQLQKAQIMVMDNRASSDVIDPLKAASEQAIRKAATKLDTYQEEEANNIRASRQGSKGHIARWKLQSNPWPIYKEQLEQLYLQCSELEEKYQQLIVSLKGFHTLYAQVQQHCDICEKELHKSEDLAHTTIAYIEEQIDSRPGKVATYLEDKEEEIEIDNHLSDFLETFETNIGKLPANLSVPVGVDGGTVKIRELNFRRNARQWLESEVLPLLYETWELTENANNGIHMALVNVRNRAIIIANDTKENKPTEALREDICQPLKSYLSSEQSFNGKLKELRAIIATRMADYFKMSLVYEPAKPFLPLPLQSTINQLRFGQSELWIGFKSSLNKWTGNLRQLIDNVEQEESLSTSEKIARFVQSRSHSQEENDQYSSIFLTKGYIGESFWVGREKELQHLESLINQWELGYRGAVFLSGQRFAGKTVFGELVAHRFFSENTVRLIPNATVRVGGRKMNTTYDLEEALVFIRKHSVNQRPLIWIDDLELWGDINNPLGQNIRILKKYIDNYSNQLFFLVSMSNWLRGHLQKTHDLDKVFQAEINLDRMSLEEMRQAILIRHGATHKVLVGQDGNEVTPGQFRKMTAKLYRIAEGNIGEALNIWSFTTYKGKGEEVIHDFSQKSNLPYFLTPEIAALLVMIMLEKRTNEYRLRKLFGPAFTDKYRSLLQRLFSTGLLTRQLDGWIELNEVAVNEVGRQLDQYNFLQFYR